MADLCYGCMKELHDEQVCPHCGFSQDAVQASHFLPLGAKLENDRYIVGKVLDNRSDSARYIGYDQKRKKTVTIQEFLPKDLFTRSENSAVVTVKKENGKKFNALKQQFMQVGNKVKGITECDCIVKVEAVFQDNNTAYIVNEYEEVIPFGEYVQRSGGRLEWEVARPLIKPLLDGLTAISEKGIAHLAICPANLVVTADGKVKLTGFAIEGIRKVDGDLPPQLFSGCSALEQYESGTKLDTVTDIYGFCATLFFALTGRLPSEALKRKEDSRLLMSTNVAKKLPPFVISTLAKGLQVNKQDRISTFKELSEQLSATPTVQAMQNEISNTVKVDTAEATEKPRKVSNFALGVISMVIALAIFGVLGYMWYSTNPLDGLFDLNETATEGASTSPEELVEGYTYPPDSKYFRVPDFTGKTWQEASTIAAESTEYYIYKAIDEEFSDTVPQGKICKQTPEANKTVTRGNDGVTITCTISKGAQFRALPEVDDLNKDQATKSLTDQGFVVNSTLTYSDDIAAGNVISYSGNAKAGDKLEYGSTVTVSISLGKKPETATEKTFVYVEEAEQPAEVIQAPTAPAEVTE
ncbi:MAG: PASTA domain-containing protein [Acutalibacteraceae bacterium]|nr:PASTA domain-containing protein [Acutalibacteraceae bacterium]